MQLDAVRVRVNPPLSGWKRSSRCDSGVCVEANFTLPGEVLVRDSKLDDGPVLSFSTEAWQRFAQAVKTGEFQPGA